MTLLWNSGLFTLREAIFIRSTTCMALPDDTAPVFSYLPIYGTQADENSASFLPTMTSGSSPMSHRNGGGSSQFRHMTFLPYLGEAVIGRLCFSCTRGVMKKKRLKKKKWGDDFGAKQWVLGTMCRWFMRARRREWRGRNCPGPLASS